MPYQRVTVFLLRPGADPAALRGLATRFSAIMVALEGCRLTCIDLLSDGSQLRSVSVWDFEENANAASHRVRGDRYPNPRCCRTAQGPPKAVIMDVGSFLGAGVRWCGGGGLCAAGCASGFCWSPRVWR